MIVALAIVAAVIGLRGRRPWTGPGAPGGVSDHDMLDSLRRADARRDWVSAVHWAELLGERRPREHTVLIARGTMWSNYAVDQRPGRVRPRPALRTSLERAACMRRAVALLDSSARAARTGAQWLDSENRLGNVYEILGLPGDALLTYEHMKQRLPGEMRPAMRAYWLRALFYDPVEPDTSEYHERMTSMGLR